MGFDWEEILDADGEDLADAYEESVADAHGAGEKRSDAE